MSSSNPITKAVFMALLTVMLAIGVKISRGAGFVFDPITMLACPIIVFLGALLGYKRRL